MALSGRRIRMTLIAEMSPASETKLNQPSVTTLKSIYGEKLIVSCLKKGTNTYDIP